MMMNVVLAQLRLPFQSAPPDRPARNTFRVFCVELDSDAQDLLQRVLDTEIQKHRFDLLDKFCGGARIHDLMWLDSLLPREDVQIVMSGPEFAHLLTYVTQRLIRVRHYHESILCNVSVDDLCAALLNIRESLSKATEIVPAHLPLRF